MKTTDFDTEARNRFAATFRLLPLTAIEFLMKKQDRMQINPNSPNDCYCGWLYRMDNEEKDMYELRDEADPTASLSELEIVYLTQTYGGTEKDWAGLYWDSSAYSLEARDALRAVLAEKSNVLA